MKSFDEVYETLPGNGWLSRAEAELLWRWVNKTDGPILEVGCHQGRSTVLLAATGRRVVAVDPFAGFSTEDPSGIMAKSAFEKNVQGQDVFLCVMRLEDLPFVGVFPFCYLDGEHTYQGTSNQLNYAKACRAEVVAVHDVNDDGQGTEIKRACLEHFGREWDERVERLAVWRVQ